MLIEKELVKCASCFFSQQANIGCGLWPGMAWKQRKHRFPGSCFVKLKMEWWIMGVN